MRQLFEARHQLLVRGGRAVDAHANRSEPAFARFHGAVQGISHALQHAVDRALVCNVRFGDVPTHFVQGAVLDRAHPLVLDGHQGSALGARLARVPTLQIPWKHDPRLFAQHFSSVHVTERKVVVAAIDERAQPAGRVRRVPRPALERRVQKPDVE